MKKYEVWGVDDAGKYSILAYANIDAPAVADTILVRGQVREIQKIWRHHAGAQPVFRLLVAEAAEGSAAEA